MAGEKVVLVPTKAYEMGYPGPLLNKMFFTKILLVLFSYCVYPGAASLPRIYLKTLLKHIPPAEIVSLTSEIDFAVGKVLKQSPIDVADFYSQLLPNQKELEGKLARHCGRDEEQCLRVCGLLMDALELGFREGNFSDDLHFRPENLEGGVLLHMQHLRLYEHRTNILSLFDSEELDCMQRFLHYVLAHLHLGHKLTQKSHFETVLRLTKDRQQALLKHFIQRSSKHYLNWLYHKSGHVYPKLINSDTVPTDSSASAWMIKMGGQPPSQISSLTSLRVFLNSGMRGILSRLHDNPGKLALNGYFILITDLLFAHQRLLELDSLSLSVAERMEYWKAERDLASLYKSTEELLPKVVKFLKDSIMQIYSFNMKSTKLNLTASVHVIDKVQMHIVDFQFSHLPIVTIGFIDSSLHIFLFGITANVSMKFKDMEKEVTSVLKLDRSFTEESLQLLLNERISKTFRLSSREATALEYLKKKLRT